MRWLAWIFLAALPGTLTGQEPLITPDTPVDSASLHQWLASGDPRLVAWAADFAQRRHDAKILAELPEWLVHSSLPLAYGRESGPAAQGDAIGAVLDALIQENVSVPVRAVEVVAPFFPAQAAILIGRLLLTESRSTLQDWTYGATGTWGGRTLARIATMMLAKDPGPSQGMWDGQPMGFAASVVAASEEELRITVRRSEYRGLGTGIGPWCGTYLPSKAPPGWPPIYTYVLVENDSDSSLPILVDLDGDRIAFWRFEEHRGWGSCNGVEWLDSATRHRLIAYWLGVKDKEVTWQPVEPFTIVWAGKAAYERQLGKLIEAERAKLRETVRSLRERGLMTEGEAAAYAPRLVVTVECDIKPCPLT